MIRFYFVAVIIAASFAAAVADASPPTTQAIYKSPTDVVVALQNASRAGDTASAVDCYTLDAQKRGVTLTVALILSTQTSQQSTQIDHDATTDFSRKYKLDQPLQPKETDHQRIERIAATIADTRSFLIDFGKLSGKPQLDPRIRPAILVDVVIKADGVHATGKIIQHTDDGDFSQEIEFAKIDNSWKLDTINAVL
jgi:hypothetical protein